MATTVSAAAFANPEGGSGAGKSLSEGVLAPFGVIDWKWLAEPEMRWTT